MANRHKPGTEPLCPVCLTERIRNRESKICHPCWLESVKRKSIEKQAAKLNVGITEQPAVRESVGTYDEARALWEKCIGQVVDHYHGPASSHKSDGRLHGVVLGDIHAPFHDAAILARAVAATRDTADLCVIPGDLADCYSVSRFIKYDTIGFAEEWATVQVVLEALSEAYPKVRVVIGNHDARLEKQIIERCTADMVEAIRWLTGGSLCPLSMLCKRYPNVEIVPHVTPDGHRMDWMTSVGDCALLHAEKYSRVPGNALRSVEEWIEDQSQSYALQGFRVIMQAHTHQMAWLPWRAGKLLVETGCLAQTQGYMTTPRIGGRPQRRGWVTFEQVDGVTDINAVRCHWADAEA